MELSEQPFAVKNKILDNSGSMWPSVVVHEHWPVSQRMIVEMGNYAWSQHIVTVFFGLSDYHHEQDWTYLAVYILN